MAQYLHIRVDDVDLLLPALQVHEVLGMGLGPSDRFGDGHAMWRDLVLHSFDLGHILQRCDAPKHRDYGVVYSLDASETPPVLMMIDEVLGLRNPQRHQLHRLPGIQFISHSLFDAIWIDAKLGHKAYCVKTQLPVHFGATQADGCNAGPSNCSESKKPCDALEGFRPNN